MWGFSIAFLPLPNFNSEISWTICHTGNCTADGANVWDIAGCLLTWTTFPAERKETVQKHRIYFLANFWQNTPLYHPQINILDILSFLNIQNNSLSIYIIDIWVSALREENVLEGNMTNTVLIGAINTTDCTRIIRTIRTAVEKNHILRFGSDHRSVTRTYKLVFLFIASTKGIKFNQNW